MKNIVILFFSCFIILTPYMSQADKNSNLLNNISSDDMLSILSMAKVTGMCGMLKQLTNFQETTRMDGGDQFILRFLRVEAARLGVTIEEFLERCKTSTSEYNKYTELFKSN